MAKKKKISKPVEKVSASITQHPVTYTGNVTLKLRKGTDVIKTIKLENSGTLLMFLGIARFFAGYFRNNNQDLYIPRYLGVGYEATPTATDLALYEMPGEYDFGTRFDLTVGNVMPDPTLGHVLIPFTATILYSSVQSNPITSLALFSGANPKSTGNMLARVNIPAQAGSDTPGIRLDVGMNLLVEWDIVIQNSKGE